MLTTRDQVIWTQRIRKEEAVNGKAVKNFSVRAVISVTDVPSKFKPGHMDPRDAMKVGESFDTKALGWAPGGDLAKEFRRSINRQKAGPRERHQFPETRGQEFGWCQAALGPPNDRSAPAGSNPSKLGIGWLQKDGHGGPTTQLAASSTPAELPPYEEKPRPRRSKEGNVREEFGVPPYGTVCGAQERAATRKAARRLEREAGLTGTASLTGLGAANATATGASGFAADQSLKQPTPHQLAKANSLPHIPIDERLGAQEAKVAEAISKSRNFMNRSDKNRNYHPLSQSDVALFADAYTACWGSCPFHKKKTKPKIV